jgi:RNA polymerase sigma factor (sigma-70 family)
MFTIDIEAVEQLDVSELNNYQFFQMLYESYYEDLYACAIYYVRHRETAEDVVHDVFCKMWCQFDHLREVVTSWQSYLFISTKHKSLNVVRKHRTEERNKELYSFYRSKTVLNEFLVKECDALFENAVKRLSRQQREIFVLKYYRFKKRIIAKELGISYFTVRNNISIAQKKLNNYLNNQMNYKRQSDDDLAQAA